MLEAHRKVAKRLKSFSVHTVWLLKKDHGFELQVGSVTADNEFLMK